MSEGGAKGTPLTALPGVGSKAAEKFLSLGVRRVEDLPYLIPRTYQDRSHPRSISDLAEGTLATVRGQVLSFRQIRFRSGAALEAVLTDGRAIIVLKWFRVRRWMVEHFSRAYPPGTEVLATGRVDSFGGRMEMHHPDLSVAGPGGGGEGIVPIYPLAAGLSQRILRKVVKLAEEKGALDVEDPIPPDILAEEGLPSLGESLRALHFPRAGDDVEALCSGDSPFHRRLKFGELLLFQLGILSRAREMRKREGIPLRENGELAGRFIISLPFALTPAQERVAGEIAADLAGEVPMYRLLQGDVGSGKTLLAFLAILQTVESGSQAAFMAPTEILAEQHHRTLSSWGDKVGVEVDLLTGKLSPGERSRLRQRIISGDAKVVVGTHALIQEGVTFPSLGLAVVDEQHRFGVLQRLILRQKGRFPHFLVMTATPIPRSLAMVLYGDLDRSVLDQMPPGRQPVETLLWGEADRSRLYLRIAGEIREGRQVYVVYPLVEESEKLELAAAREMAEHFQKKVFPHLKVGLLTGRMPPEEKERVMEAFRQGAYQMLVATTVIEVGVDVSNATLMVVEHAERFGLFQLHQLRGRVGRGTHSSRCILMAGSKAGEEARRRLAVMVRTRSGFEIAEEDLRLRGPGDFLGTRQAGLPDFRFAHPLRDTDLLTRARKTAERILSGAPPASRSLTDASESFWSERMVILDAG